MSDTTMIAIVFIICMVAISITNVLIMWSSNRDTRRMIERMGKRGRDD